MQNKEIVTQLPANPSEIVYAITMETILSAIVTPALGGEGTHPVPGGFASSTGRGPGCQQS